MHHKPHPPHGPHHGHHHRGHHPHPHLGPHHHGPGRKPSEMMRQLRELQAMGASDNDLHAVLDRYVTASGISTTDPGRGAPELAVNPFDRYRAVLVSVERAVDECLAALRNKEILVAGEFPPHLLDELLHDGAMVTQIHPLTHHGDKPPHFRHLARFGLRGLIDLQDLATTSFDIVLIHGSKNGDRVSVSPLVPIVLQMFQGAEIYLLDDDCFAPHMLVVITDSGFTPMPFQS